MKYLVGDKFVDYTLTNNNQPASYVFSGPSYGVVESGNIFTVQLVQGYGLAGSATINLTDSISDGSFNPPSVNISTISPIASSIYTCHRYNQRLLICSNTGVLVDPQPKLFTGFVNVGSSMTDSTCRCISLGGFFPKNSNWWRELCRDISNDPIHPQSNLMISRYTTTKCSIAMDAAGGAGMPYNVVPGNQPIIPISIVPGIGNGSWPPGQSSAPIFWTQSQELVTPGSPQPSSYILSNSPHHDHHVMIFNRDEVKGYPTTLDEIYQFFVQDDGVNFGATNLIRYDLEAGYPPNFDANPSADAAGLPVSPLLIRYDDVLLGDIGHAMRLAPGNGYTEGCWVYPARCSNYVVGKAGNWMVTTGIVNINDTYVQTYPLRNGYGSTFLIDSTPIPFTNGITVIVSGNAASNDPGFHIYPASGAIPVGHCGYVNFGMPFGSRYRLKSSWLVANSSNYTNNVNVVLRGLNKYGGILADGAQGLYLNGVSDNRWTNAEILSFYTIPVSAFEVPQWTNWMSLTGPSTGYKGNTYTFYVQLLITGYQNFNAGIYLEYSQNGTNWSLGPNTATFTESLTGIQSLSFIPPNTGVYILKPTNIQYWLEPPPIAFTAY